MIFIVDDDARVRSSAAQALRDAGYEVQEFSGGSAALAALASNTRVGLILSDILMPEMSGPDFVAAALTLRPDLKVQFISGDIGDTKAEQLAPWPLLAKPFTATALKKAIEAALTLSPEPHCETGKVAER